MAQAAETTPVLARMVKPSGTAEAPAADLARLLGLAAMRTGQDTLGLRLAVTGADGDSAGGEAVAGALPDPALLLRLEQAELCSDTPAGLLALCPQLVAALIEMQTTGAVLPRAAEPRAPTPTDAAMAEEFAAGLLERFAVLSAHVPDPPPMAGLALNGRFTDAGAAAMTLAAGPHRRWQVTLDLAGGAKTGSLVLAVAPPGAAAPRSADPVWHAAFEQAVMSSPAALDAVLTRLRLPLSEVGALEAGQVLPLGPAALDDVTLAAPGGAHVARARLGRSGDRRAVRISEIDAGAARAAPVQQQEPDTEGPAAVPAPLAAVR